jgi:hypothetical protein
MWYSMRREARAGSRRSVRVRSAEDSAVAMGSKVRPVCEGKDSRVRSRPGGEGFQDGSESFFLLRRRDDSGVDLAVAAEVVAVVETADFFRCGFGLITLEEVQGDERVFELGEWRALGDGVFAEALEGGGADGHNPIEFVGGVGAVVPEMGVGVCSAEGTGVFVGDEDEAGLLTCCEDGIEGGGVLGGFV